jgi:hypothetical protein
MIAAQFSIARAVSISPISVMRRLAAHHRVGIARPIVVMCHAERAAALARRPVARRPHQLPRLLRRLQHRHHDPVGAGIQHPRDRGVADLRHAHPDRDVEAAGAGDLLLDGLDADAGVLHVEHDIFAARGLQERDQARREELERHRAVDPLAGVQAPA